MKHHHRRRAIMEVIFPCRPPTDLQNSKVNGKLKLAEGHNGTQTSYSNTNTPMWRSRKKIIFFPFHFTTTNCMQHPSLSGVFHFFFLHYYYNDNECGGVSWKIRQFLSPPLEVVSLCFPFTHSANQQQSIPFPQLSGFSDVYYTIWRSRSIQLTFILKLCLTWRQHHYSYQQFSFYNFTSADRIGKHYCIAIANMRSGAVSLCRMSSYMRPYRSLSLHETHLVQCMVFVREIYMFPRKRNH